MVAKVLLLMKAGLPRPPEVRLSRAPLDTQTRSFRSIEKTPEHLSKLHRSNNQRPRLNITYTNPGANWEDISPGLSPAAAAAIAAKPLGNWAPCSAADSPDGVTIS